MPLSSPAAARIVQPVSPLHVSPPRLALPPVLPRPSQSWKLTAPLNAPLAALLSAGSLLAGAYPAAAVDSPPAQVAAAATMDEILVVGQRGAPITIVPRGLSVSLGEEQFKAINAVNVEDLMKYAPNFFVRKRYIGDANGVPGFRGTHSTQSARSLVLVDGFVVSNLLGNSFSFPPKWGVVGPGEVKQFDIVYGPYSSRYPGNAMGGIISITTRPPEGTESFATLQTFAQPYQQYGTDETYRGYTAEGGFSWKGDGPFSLRLSYRRLDNKGQPMQFRQLTPATGTAPATTVTGAVVDSALITPGPVFAADSPDRNVQDQVRARVGLDLGQGMGADWTASGLFLLWNTRSDTTNPTTYLRDAAGNPVYQGRVRFNGQLYNTGTLTLGLTDRREYMAGLRLAGKAEDWSVSGNLSRFWIDRQLSRSSTSYQTGISNGAGTFTRQGDTGWTTGDLTAERRLGDVTLAVGTTGSLYETAQDIFSTTGWRSRDGETFTNRTAGKTRLAGAWVDSKWQVRPGFSLTAGARVDDWRAYDGGIGRSTPAGPRFQNYAERTASSLDPSLGVQFEALEGWPVQISLATATRYPTVGELFQARLDGNGVFDPNSFDPNLKEERSRDANLIVRHALDDVRLTGSLFWQRVENTIFSQTGFNQFGVITSSFKNIDLVRQWGVEAIVEAADVGTGWGIDGLALELNAAWIQSETLKNRSLPASEGVQFPRIPLWRINGNARWQLDETKLLSAGFRYASRPNTNLEGTQRGDTFGYTSELLVVDAKASWEFWPGVEVSLGVDNLFNDRAWVFHPYPQRTFVLEFKWRG
jgi:iron complex outermembrane recepter protein